MDLLMQALKDKLHITWDEEETNRKLIQIIESAKVTLDYKLGANIDYYSLGQEQNLFLNYCMYLYNNCANEFDDNYINEIYQIRQMYEVKNHEQQL